jgi:hypothetical protein
MSVKNFFPLAALFIASGLTAQTPAISGTFVSTLGSDTLQIERFTRTRDKLEGDIVRRMPRVQVVHYVADLAGGRWKGMSTTVRRYGADPAAAPNMSIVALLADTTASLEVQRNGKTDSASSGNRSFKGRAAATVSGSPPSIGVYEQILASNPPVGKDSVVINLIGGAAANNATLTLVRRSRDSVAFISSFFPGWVEMATVDASGRIQSLDAAATTVKAVTRRAANLDFDAVTKSWGASETAHGPAGQMSPPDTVRATLGTASVEIAYSRPFKRGRTIFGSNIVPWNVVWRTGANAATQLTTSADLMIGNTVVPAGKYTLWTLPTPTGAKLIINSQTGQWGTDYDMSKDFARVDVVQTILTKPVEEFTFAIVPQGSGTVLKYSWDDREFSVPIRAR